MVAYRGRVRPTIWIPCVHCKGDVSTKCTLCRNERTLDGELELQILVSELHPTNYADYITDYIWLFEHLGQEWLHDPRYLLILDVIHHLQLAESTVVL